MFLIKRMKWYVMYAVFISNIPYIRFWIRSKCTLQNLGNYVQNIEQDNTATEA